MSETAILSIQIIGSIVGIIVFLFAFIRFVLPTGCKYLVKPRIKTKTSFGKEIDVKSPLTKVKLFTARESTVWLCTNRNIELLSATFRRLCKYQENCMLYRFFLKTGLLNDNNWCHCASVDDWYYTDSFVCPSNDSERDNQSRGHFTEGRLTLVPKMNRILKASWVALDVPLRLRDKKSHIIELTISFKVKVEDTPLINRFVNKILTPTNREITYSVRRKIYTNLADTEEKKSKKTKHKEADRITGHRVAFSYQGFGKMVEYIELMQSLVEGIKVVLKNGKAPTSKMPAYVIRNELKEKFPQIHTVSYKPPDYTYYTADKETYKLAIQKVWVYVRDFARGFLDCESYSILCSHSMSCFLLMPEILSRAYVYLLIASESPIVSIAVDISNRSNMLVIALVRSIYSELRVIVQMVGQKRKIRKEVDKLASYFNLAESKSLG